MKQKQEYDQYATMASHHLAPPFLLGQSPLSAPATIINKISILLRVSQHAHSRKDQARRTNVPEVESRLEWDTLMNEFVTSKELVKFRSLFFAYDAAH
jgi:hypothetical protein